MAEAVPAWSAWLRKNSELNVSRTALTNRLHRGASRYTRPPTNRTLAEAQEHAICHYLEHLDQCGNRLSFQWLKVWPLSTWASSSRPIRSPFLKSVNHGTNALSTGSLCISSANKSLLPLKETTHTILTLKPNISRLIKLCGLGVG